MFANHANSFILIARNAPITELVLNVRLAISNQQNVSNFKYHTYFNLNRNCLLIMPIITF